MLEFVIVFENNRVDPKVGDLLIHSIRLTPPTEVNAQVHAKSVINELTKKAWLWFDANRDPDTGLVLDRAPNAVTVENRPRLCSIASVGYYLSMLPEGVRTGLITREEAAHRSATVMRFSLEELEHHHGLLYHFVDASNGKTSPGSEASALDSAIFLNGCMVAAQAFKGEVASLADQLLDRVEWTQFIVKDPRSEKSMLAFGWSQDKGLLSPMDVRSSELAMPYFLAVGSRTHPIDPQLWYNTKVVLGEVAGQEILNPGHALFTSYYGLGWHDLRGRKDREGVDLEENARLAALANRAFCRQLSEEYDAYSLANGGWWGISAGDSPSGYIAPGPVSGRVEGTVWPTTSLAAITWIPEVIEEDVALWRKSPLWDTISGPYGLAPTNPGRCWVGKDLIGIDLGSMYINVANHKNSTVRDLWMQHPIAIAALDRLEY